MSAMSELDIERQEAAATPRPRPVIWAHNFHGHEQAPWRRQPAADMVMIYVGTEFIGAHAGRLVCRLLR